MDYNLANLPSVNISRTKFNRTQSHNLSFNLGELCILQCQEVLPGSTHKLEYGSLIRMSNPIAPIMDDIQYDVFTFFCPSRLTWDNWKRFMGENTTGAGSINNVNSDKTIPYYTTLGSEINSIADDLGVPAKLSVGVGIPYKISALPFRAFMLIYNRWFRNQNVEAPNTIALGDTTSGDSLSLLNGLYNSGGSLPSGAVPNRLVAYKLPDYFTSCLPYAQKGDPVSILPNDLPVYGSNSNTHNLSVPIQFKSYPGFSANAVGSAGFGTLGYMYSDNSSSSFTTPVAPVNLYAKVSGTINDLRFAFQLQKFLEKDALYGSRYWEILHAHFAVTSPDASLQDPQLLGHVKFDINIQQVLQTTGYTDPTSTSLGTPGANSTTGSKGHLATASFCEHGYLMTIGVARQKRHTYSMGINKMFLRSSRLDYYWPVFANLGAQKVTQKEIYTAAPNPDSVFGYQEAWADYRFLPSYNSGLLNPNRSGSLDYWTLADKYSTPVSLGLTFLKESRANLSRALVTGATGPDFIGSFYFKDTTVNPMPIYSIPGFADHH